MQTVFLKSPQGVDKFENYIEMNLSKGAFVFSYNNTPLVIDIWMHV